MPSLIPFLHSPPHISQILTQFLVTGQHHDPFLARHFIKHLIFSLSPHLAVSLFSFLSNPDAFISNTIIKSFLLNSNPKKPRLFSVANSSLCFSNLTFPLRTKLLSHRVLAQNGKLLHAQIVKLGIEDNSYDPNSAIYTYACFGDLGSACKLFERLVEEAYLVTWNSMIDWYVKNRMVEAA